MRLVTLLPAALLTACASGPVDRASAPSAPAASASVAAAAVPQATVTPPAAASAAPGAVVAPDMDAASSDGISEPAVAKAKAGYTLSRQNGETVYCRREVPTGSRRPVTNCYTPAQLEEIESRTKETQDAMERQRNSSGCGKFCRAGS